MRIDGNIITDNIVKLKPALKQNQYFSNKYIFN